MFPRREIEAVFERYQHCGDVFGISSFSLKPIINNTKFLSIIAMFDERTQNRKGSDSVHNFVVSHLGYIFCMRALFELVDN